MKILWHSRLFLWSHPFYYFRLCLLTSFSSITCRSFRACNASISTLALKPWKYKKWGDLPLFRSRSVNWRRKIAHDHDMLLSTAITVVYGSSLFSNGRASNPISIPSSFGAVIENPSFPLWNITSILSKSIIWWNRHKCLAWWYRAGPTGRKSFLSWP